MVAGNGAVTQTIPQLVAILETMGSDVTYHREEGGVACPCRSQEGFRDPAWHRLHPGDPVCNEQGFLVDATEYVVKASVQPAQAGYRRMEQRAEQLLGSVETDDKLGIFPCVWGAHTLNFDDWSDAGEDYILYDGERYTVVSADKVPDVDGDPSHHWEVGLRLMRLSRAL